MERTGGKNFNSRPREGGDNRLDRFNPDEFISIRAPARGATAKIHKTCELMLLNNSFVL